jgi:hypothetical protein
VLDDGVMLLTFGCRRKNWLPFVLTNAAPVVRRGVLSNLLWMEEQPLYPMDRYSQL